MFKHSEYVDPPSFEGLGFNSVSLLSRGDQNTSIFEMREEDYKYPPVPPKPPQIKESYQYGIPRGPPLASQNISSDRYLSSSYTPSTPPYLTQCSTAPPISSFGPPNRHYAPVVPSIVLNSNPRPSSGGWRASMKRQRLTEAPVKKIKITKVDVPKEIQQRVLQIATQDSPEEIAKYIAERRKSFPTQSMKVKEEISTDETTTKREESPLILEEDKSEQFCMNYNRGHCRLEKRCKRIHDPIERASFLKAEWEAPRKMGKLILPKPADSLVRKLLSKEIQNEYDIVLQCFRLFVENSFLQGSEFPQKAPLIVEDEDSLEEGEIID